ncbi:MAG: hypothetical protein ACYC1E_06515 [Propionibacteriaceae bacterium]
MADESPGTYVHAKVGIVDQWLTIGSANLNIWVVNDDLRALIGRKVAAERLTDAQVPLTEL